MENWSDGSYNMHMAGSDLLEHHQTIKQLIDLLRPHSRRYMRQQIFRQLELGQ